MQETNARLEMVRYQYEVQRGATEERRYLGRPPGGNEASLHAYSTRLFCPNYLAKKLRAQAAAWSERRGASGALADGSDPPRRSRVPGRKPPDIWVHGRALRPQIL